MMNAVENMKDVNGKWRDYAIAEYKAMITAAEEN
jgi:hypothetical protein